MIGKFEERKGYRELLEAFAQAFGNSPEVELLIKADYFIDVERGKAGLAKLLSSAGCRHVRTYSGMWSKEHLLGLYNYCDVFVFPSRAEGWGLPLLEAAATGMPLIAAFYGGPTQFLEYLQSSLTRIDYSLVKIEDGDFKRFWPTEDGDLGRWAQPSVESLAAAMISSRDQFAALREEAVANSQVAREKFSWDNSANSAVEVLNRERLLKPEYTVIG